MIVCNELETDFLEFPPTLIIEILSPSTSYKDRTIKFEIYQSQGVLFYILLDYQTKTNTVYELIDNKYEQVKKIVFNVDQDCIIAFDFEKIFK